LNSTLMTSALTNGEAISSIVAKTLRMFFPLGRRAKTTDLGNQSERN
jgi:hypothetical protein